LGRLSSLGMAVLGPLNPATSCYCASSCVAPMHLAPARGRGRGSRKRPRDTLLAGACRERLIDRFALSFPCQRIGCGAEGPFRPISYSFPFPAPACICQIIKYSRIPSGTHRSRPRRRTLSPICRALFMNLRPFADLSIRTLHPLIHEKDLGIRAKGIESMKELRNSEIRYKAILSRENPCLA